jgi:hypothetical protein
MYPTLATIASSSSKEKYGLYLYYESWKKIDYQLHLVKLLGVLNLLPQFLVTLESELDVHHESFRFSKKQGHRVLISFCKRQEFVSEQNSIVVANGSSQADQFEK